MAGLLGLALLLLGLCARAAASSVRYRVLEELPVGSVIGRLADDAAEALARLPGSVSPRFRAVTRRGAAASTALSVRERDGEISVRARLDREALCSGGLTDSNCSLEFDVLTLPTEHLQLFHVVVGKTNTRPSSRHGAIISGDLSVGRVGKGLKAIEFFRRTVEEPTFDCVEQYFSDQSSGTFALSLEGWRTTGL